MQTPHVLIIGSGVAGLSVARHLPPTTQVTVLSKGSLTDGATPLAQGGIAMPLGKGDSVQQHVSDTIVAGNQHNDEHVVQTIIQGAATAYDDLVSIGFAPDRNADGSLHMGLEGGHSMPRIVHAKDATGKHLHDVLLDDVLTKSWIRLMPYTKAVSLSVNDSVVTGLHTQNMQNGEYEYIKADVVVLATGGVGAQYEQTTNPSTATADGILLAMQADVQINHLDWIQWHPTAMVVPDRETPANNVRSAPMPLITEALRGAGALLVDVNGNEVVPKSLHPLGCLAPRDVVTRACKESMARTHHPCVYLDTRGIPAPKIETEFPGVLATCLSYGIDPRKQTIPVAPAVHYLCGGIATDDKGATTCGGLYAVGECADAGFHGNNRLASNSLLEGLVMGKRCADAITNHRPLTTINIVPDSNITVE